MGKKNAGVDAAAKKGKEKVVKAKKELKQAGKFNIAVKVNLLLLCSIIVSIVITAVVNVSYSKDLVIDSAYGKMLNIVSSYGALVDKAEADSGNTKALPMEDYEAIIKDVKLDGVDSSVCYLLNRSGIIVYHPDPSMCGKPNKNAVLKDVIASITKGKIPDGLCAEYEENGVKGYCSYYITTNRSLLVMCANGDELMKPISELMTRSIVIGIVIMIVAMLISFILVSKISTPLKQITAVINDTANLKLKLPENIDVLCNRKDETGSISRAVKQMTLSLQDVVGKIDTASGEIELNMSSVEESSNQIHTLCTDNSATAEELAASAEQVANMTSNISEHMGEMRKQSVAIKTQTEENSKVSDEISERADNLQSTTRGAIDRTTKLYHQIKDRTEAAMKELQAVEKIDELTAAISDISDQTSLLSLNASIEAARAGEAGRGFSVVASEISNLANRSKDTVGDINGIISEVNAAVSNIQVTIEETMNFLEKNVLTDYDDFNKIGDQYRQDADMFKNSMLSISGDIDNLNESIQQVAGNLNDIQETIAATSIGVADVAEKTTDVANATKENYSLTGDTVTRVDELKKIVKLFEI